FCHAVILLGVLRWSDSTGSFFLNGCGLALLLDRYFVRLLPWRSVLWRREVCLRCTAFLAGAVVFYLSRPGIVPITEAVYRGVMTCLACALLEQIPCAVGWTGRRHWAAAVLVVVLGVLVAPVIAFLHPLHTVPKRGPDAGGMAFEDVRFRS